jgi:hypothetical protein
MRCSAGGAGRGSVALTGRRESSPSILNRQYPRSRVQPPPSCMPKQGASLGGVQVSPIFKEICHSGQQKEISRNLPPLHKRTRNFQKSTLAQRATTTIQTLPWLGTAHDFNHYHPDPSLGTAHDFTSLTLRPAATISHARKRERN